ncbi:hypothetical protein WPS_31890 [Vulcanimicrobium alpinum]|uniref:Pyrrolo-quinoline quinone repeat domain-containing protein n=1 Tax=Vulcanimicrobium alpinum TaxID=3016050 RepID=A0AAN1Y0C2_UNVUL|nr:PQQ-binding-like beta-propeller repeat protein [Vulcanimicrobium alpinum]BDE07913.1 hypothetical protein WPS_31890 [Vulcanimicrobium alpinum]
MQSTPGPTVATDDWITYAHDQARSGLQLQATGITRSSAGSLKQRWKVSLGETIYASPIVAGGAVYVATDSGTVAALDAATGALRWRVHVGSSVRATPALIDGTLFVGVYGVANFAAQTTSGAAVVALDPATGAQRWRAVPQNAGNVGLVRSEPVVLNGVVYEGLAGGDDTTGCVSGGVMALDERSGTPVMNFWATAQAGGAGGGGVWSPFSTDGTNVYVGTGNGCGTETAGYSDAMVSLTRSLSVNWSRSAFVAPGGDEDVGGALNVAGTQAYFVAKSGLLYAVDRNSGNVAWQRDLKPWTRGGGAIGTPTGDGTMIIVTGGELQNPDLVNPPGCAISAFDLSGNPLYTFSSQYVVYGHASFVPGVGVIGLDHQLVAFNSQTGQTLWSSGDLGANLYASPAIVPSGVYTATLGGDVVAFSQNGVLPSLLRRR